jgi:hypothetical protein
LTYGVIIRLVMDELRGFLLDEFVEVEDRPIQHIEIKIQQFKIKILCISGLINAIASFKSASN